MARKKGISQTEPDLIDEEWGDPFEVEAALTELPSGEAKISLFRVKPIGTPAYIAAFDPSEFSLDLVKSLYGGGKYKVKALQGKTLVRQDRFEIEGPPANQAESAIVKDALGRFVRSSSPQSVTYVNPQQPQSPYNELLIEMRKLREEITRRPEPKTDFAEFAKMIAAMREIIAPPEKSLPQELLTTLVTFFNKGVEAGTQGEALPAWVPLVERFAPMINKVADALSARAVSVNHPAVTDGQGQKMQLPPFLAEFLPILRASLPLIILSASKNGDPEFWAGVILSHMPDNHKGQILEWLNGEEWFKVVSSFDARVAAQAAWWQELKQAIIELAKPAEEEVIQ